MSRVMQRKRNRLLLVVLVVLAIVTSFNFRSILSAPTKAKASEPSHNQELFKIQVIDAETGRGIPAVELRTTNNILYYTDSAGYVAFNEPGLMDQEVFFHLSSHGYEVPKDGFGNRGQAVDIKPGGSITIKMNRVNIAERLYRITGQGIYRDSVLLGLTPPIKEPLLNGKVMGSDSVQTIEYQDKLYWFWGDTDRPAYPLGNFRVTGATSELPGKGGLDPEVGVDLDYFTKEDGFVKSLVPPLPDGAGIAWVFGLMTTEDDTGKERLLAGYSTHTPLSAFGILVFNDEKEEFEQLVEFPDKEDWRHPGGQASYYEEDGQGYWVFTEHHMGNLRVLDSYEAIQDHEQYESFTCLTPGTEFDGKNTSLERDDDGNLVWDWKLDTQPLEPDQEKELIELGLIKEDDLHYFQLKDVDTGDYVSIASSSVEWNEYRNKYVMIGQQVGGDSSVLGEVWYSEAPAPQGPWESAKKIVTHDNYTFYNVAHDEFFDKDGGKTIFFEGTYTNTFTDHEPTPRYNYNQMMYKLDLTNPDLSLEPSDGEDDGGEDGVEESATVAKLFSILANYEDEYSSKKAYRALQVHLAALQQYEEKEEVKKIVKHTKSFLGLLDKQKEEDLISEKAYEELSAGAEELLQKWE
ncbi:DUF4185 domain-containing protein [Lederbergia sp. NSJ-179]|uniref:DUF4185 domain-containing protein n=1 Tax=Lederbergia sp. NSJ-179 TaxID=2931402 RepID=UPI001FD29A7B|nr:DUF4185 domain-containing protein [Lederbergia sp. NSJ-179]MCJ7839853.1 DUF4185 domain-containing protein [Lederbergia sp. NSJ-179]